jgi:hypothetical protein
MSQRPLALPWTVLAILMLPGFGMQARADYGLESKRPLSDPGKAKIDERATGTWRATIDNKQYFLHAGTGNIVGKSNWVELVLVNAGDEKPTFYLHHKIGFISTIGNQRFFNVANLSVLVSQLHGTKTEDLTRAVDRYDILKYELNGDHLDVWPAEQDVVRAAIESGKIKGTGATIDDTPANILRFIESAGAKLWGDKIRYTRVK